MTHRPRRLGGRSNICAGVLTSLLVLSPAAMPSLGPGAVDAAPPAEVRQAFDEQAVLVQLRGRIAGREESPAAAVFSNVSLLRDVPAARLLRIMELGYSRALGRSCDHCHDTGDWASDSKGPKRIARGMIALTNSLNASSLPAIEGLRDRSPTVNCATCHRGEIKPALTVAPISAALAPSHAPAPSAIPHAERSSTTSAHLLAR